jgi:hypothetical protein
VRRRAALLLLFSLAAPPGAAGAPATPAPPRTGQPAPAFTLPDTGDKKRSLSEFCGREAALFFFCGCHWCLDVAKEWSALQRGGALTAEETGRKPPVTLVVYSGLSRDAARHLSTLGGLEPAQTVTLPDLKMAVSRGVYRAEPCPRVFVIDRQGLLRYTNDRPEDAPRTAPAALLAARTLDALREAAAPAKPGP